MDIDRFPEDLQSLYGELEESRSHTETELSAILSRASSARGLELVEAAALLMAPPSWDQRIFHAAAALNEQTKGRVITFYGVVYIHDACINHCRYCGDSLHISPREFRRKILTLDEFVKDVQALLRHHPLKEICFLSGETPKFKNADLIAYLQAISPYYEEKIVLNIPPLSVADFQSIRAALSDHVLHFRVFQETFDAEAYRREHVEGPKTDMLARIDAQSRALQAGFDQVGHGILYGINDKPNGALFDTLAIIAHVKSLHRAYGKWSQSISFPRVQDSPGNPDYVIPSPVPDEQLIRCVAVTKLALPDVDTVITCRESAKFRRSIRPIVNIEDFAARPGPGGNSMPEVRQQMFLPDMRSGEIVREEIISDGYAVR